MPLTLRRSQSVKANPFYEVLSKEEVIGSIQQYVAGATPGQWRWEVTALRVPMGQMQGVAASLEEAKGEIAAAWRGWLVKAGLKEVE